MLKTYRVKVQHDNGIKAIQTKALGIFAAREIVKAAEGCPDSAILSVVRINAKTGKPIK